MSYLPLLALAVVAILLLVSAVQRQHRQSINRPRRTPIDNAIGKAWEYFDSKSPSPTIGALTSAVSSIHPITKVADVIRTQFSNQERDRRVRTMLETLGMEVQDHAEALARLETSDHQNALIVAYVQSTFTTNEERIKRFGRILGRSAKDPDPSAGEEAAAFIRDLSQLREHDIEAMKLLEETQAGIHPDPDPNRYTERFEQTISRVQEAGIQREDFYSRCLRLSGFGLAIEVERNLSRMSLPDHCFHLTGRGYRLLELIRE